MNNYHINVVNLVKNFDKQSVIKNISFSVKKNSIVGILGKNGAGKTTLLGMLLGLITPTKGDVYIFGKNLRFNKKEILSEINFQSPYIDLPKKMTVEQCTDECNKDPNCTGITHRKGGGADDGHCSRLQITTLAFVLSEGHLVRSDAPERLRLHYTRL